MKDKAKITEILQAHTTPDTPEGCIRVEDAVKAMQQYGRDKKINGAKSFAKLVKEMRFSQQRYFDTRSDESLAQAKSLEQRVDQSIKMISGK